MAFDLHPDDDPMTLAPGATSDPQPFRPRFSPEGTMFLRLVRLTRGQAAAPPTVALQAGTGKMTALAAGTSTELTGSSDPGAPVVADADLAADPSDVYRIRVFPRDTGNPPVQWALQITNGDSAPRAFRWVVADAAGEAGQPRITVPRSVAVELVTDRLAPVVVTVGNRGTGDLHVTASGSDLGSGFTLVEAPAAVPPNGDGALRLAYAPPATLPAGGMAIASITHTLVTDDPVAQRPGRRDARVTVTATVRAPLWRPGDILVVDTNAGDGTGARGALIRIDPITGRQTVVSSGQRFSAPAGVALDADGHALVADGSAGDGSGAVIRVDRVTGAQSVLSAGNLFVDPISVVVTAAGRVVVADFSAFGGTGGLVAVDPRNGQQTAFASGPPLDRPVMLAVDDPQTGSIVVLNAAADAQGRWLVRVDPSGHCTAFPSDGNPQRHVGLAVDADRKVIVATQKGSVGTPRLFALAPDGTPTPIGAGAPLRQAVRLRLDSAGYILVTDWRTGDLEPQVIRDAELMGILPDPLVGIVSRAGVLRTPMDLVVVPGGAGPGPI